MVSQAYAKLATEIGQGNLSWTSDTIKILLVTDAYTYDENHDFVNDVSGSEATGATRQTLASPVFTPDTANDRVVYDAADATFLAVTSAQTISGAVVYKEVTDDTDSPLIAFLDGTDLAANGSDIQVQFAATGVFYVSYASA
ncbi:MAG: hypothetical protein AAF773_27575 [Cyanobacteria bacterium P01_D01_bin.115]